MQIILTQEEYNDLRDAAENPRTKAVEDLIAFIQLRARKDSGELGQFARNPSSVLRSWLDAFKAEQKQGPFPELEPKGCGVVGTQHFPQGEPGE